MTAQPAAQPVPHSRLDTSKLSPSESFALFQAGLAVSHDVSAVQGNEPFEAQLDAWMIGGMMVTAGHQGPSRIVRGSRRIQSDGLDHVTFMHLVHGEVIGEAGRPLHCRAGETFVLDSAATMDVTSTANRNVGVRLSRNALVGAGIDPGGLNGMVLTGAVGAIVGDYFATLVRHAFLITSADAPVLERATLALLARCLQGTGQPTGGVPSVEARRRAADHIERCLADPALDGAKIASATGLSRSVLYRAFPGGIDRYLGGRRLDRAFALLSDPGESRSIAEIGFAVGFSDPSHFSTVFRRRFKATASQVRRSGAEAAHNSLLDAYQLWLTALATRQGGSPH